MYFVIKSMLDS